MKYFEQWQIPRGTKIKLQSGEEITFLKMDGMYAQWLTKDGIVIGNFDKFIFKNGSYSVAKEKKDEK